MLKHPFCRPLHNRELVKDFFINVLRINNPNKKLVNKISKCELNLDDKNYNKYPTLTHSEHRDSDSSDDNLRWKLRKKIVEELITLKKLDNDDKIRRNKGGAIPINEIQKLKQAYIIIGLPASGKSGIVDKIAEHYGCVILDPDYAKRKLPEYDDISGASLVNSESSMLIWGGYKDENMPDDFNPLVKYCIQNSYNVIIPKIGNDFDSIYDLSKTFINTHNYEVHLTLIYLDRQKATYRALERFKESKRYVPLSLIFDAFGNDPTLTYYRLKNFHLNLFKSIGMISTDVPFGHEKECIDFAGEGNPALFYNK